MICAVRGGEDLGLPEPMKAAAGRLTRVSVPVLVWLISSATVAVSRRLRLVRNGSCSSPLPLGEPSPGLRGPSSPLGGLTISHPVQIGVPAGRGGPVNKLAERFQKLDSSPASSAA